MNALQYQQPIRQHRVRDWLVDIFLALLVVLLIGRVIGVLAGGDLAGLLWAWYLG